MIDVLLSRGTIFVDHFEHGLIHSVSLLCRIEYQIHRLFLALFAGTRRDRNNLNGDIHQSVPPFEQLFDIPNLQIEHGLP